jgi:hypothetical protein
MSIFPRWTSRFRSPAPAVGIKALQANHIPRFQTHSVRNSAGRQNTTPLDVSAGRQTGRNYVPYGGRGSIIFLYSKSVRVRILKKRKLVVTTLVQSCFAELANLLRRGEYSEEPGVQLHLNATQRANLQVIETVLSRMVFMSSSRNVSRTRKRIREKTRLGRRSCKVSVDSLPTESASFRFNPHPERQDYQAGSGKHGTRH